MHVRGEVTGCSLCMCTLSLSLSLSLKMMDGVDLRVMQNFKWCPQGHMPPLNVSDEEEQHLAKKKKAMGSIKAFLIGKFPHKAESIDRCCSILKHEDIDVLSDLKGFSYQDIHNMGVSAFLAKALELGGHLRGSSFGMNPNGTKTVPFRGLQDCPTAILPFKGRDDLMIDVAKTVEEFVENARVGLNKSRMQFLTFEGLAGVGKTRCLLETMEQVKRVIGRGDSTLANLYKDKAVNAVYITFNGSGIGNKLCHKLCSPFIQQMGAGAYVVGGQFMKVCIVAEVLYGQPFAYLESNVKETILSQSMETSMHEVAKHVRKSHGLESGQWIALYLLMDESQLLVEELQRHQAIPFLKGMFSAVGQFMTSETEGSSSMQCKLVLIPMLGGTILPVGGQYGVTEWSRVSKVLPALDVEPASEVLREAMVNHYITRTRGFSILLKDCSCLPRLMENVYRAFCTVQHSSMSDEEMLRHLRDKVSLIVQAQASSIITEGNRSLVKRMVLLCLTEKVVEEPSDFEKSECARGYVSPVQVDGGVKYRAPRMMLHVLAGHFGLHWNVLKLHEESVKGDFFEYAFLEMLYARMILHAGSEISIFELFPGMQGRHDLLQQRIMIGRQPTFHEEKYGFLNSRTKRFQYTHNNFVETLSGQVELPVADIVSKTACGNYLVDGRAFVQSTTGNKFEFWLQLKGEKVRYDMAKVADDTKKAFDPSLTLTDRKVIYVIVSQRGFTCSITSPKLDSRVCFFDTVGLSKFMPGILDRNN
ncbi:hypothetical protein GOP47_0026914 [Adiantum capillus-veneris]|nr:hypothetical protein GOP47_0026914 [Adiantum capillus-veneris]